MTPALKISNTYDILREMPDNNTNNPKVCIDPSTSVPQNSTQNPPTADDRALLLCCLGCYLQYTLIALQFSQVMVLNRLRQCKCRICMQKDFRVQLPLVP